MLKIALAERDKEHLEHFQADIGSTHMLTKNISFCSRRNPNWKDSICYHLTIYSKKLIQTLAIYEIKPRKTQNLQFPLILINNKYINHLCRGYFDGDGGFSINNSRNNPQLQIGIRGTKHFLSSYNQILVKNANLPDRCLTKSLGNPKKDGTGNLAYCGNNICTDIAKWLYSNLDSNSRYLKRKFNIVESYL